MPRPVWTGAISFGMVAIPIRLVPAVRKKSISFNQLDDRNMARIRYRKVNEESGEEVPSEHIVKGYDLGGGSYVTVTDDDLAPLQPVKSKEIDLETFVPESDVNPMMFDSSYLVLPDKNAKPYALLADAMAGSGRVGIGRFVMRQKEYLAAIRSDGTHLTLSTLVFPDELVEPASVEEFAELDDVEISDKELKMAQGLVEALSDDFQPEQYTDEYRTGVERIIEEKAAGRTPVFEAEAAPRAAVIDLAAALEASLAEARAAKQRHPSSTTATAKKSTRSSKKAAAAWRRTLTTPRRLPRHARPAPASPPDPSVSGIRVSGDGQVATQHSDDVKHSDEEGRRQVSRTTSDGSLSSRRPRKTGARRPPPSVHSRKPDLGDEFGSYPAVGAPRQLGWMTNGQ